MRCSHQPERPPANPVTTSSTRHLVAVLGDQLDAAASALDGFEPSTDRIWMAEVAEESEHVRSSKPRTALFLSAMRHFADDLRRRGWPLDYVRLDDEANRGTLGAELGAARVIVTHPGEWRVRRALESAAAQAGLPLEVRDDQHFYVMPAQFAEHARRRKQLRMEYFYRELRRRHGVLMDGDTPASADDARRDHTRRAGAGRPPFREASRPARPLRMARDARGRPGRPGRLHRTAPPAVRAMPGRHVDRRAQSTYVHSVRYE